MTNLHAVAELHRPPVDEPGPAVPLIRARGVSVSYGARRVLGDVSLDIARGSVTALIGPSGCGKTSFLGCLNRMVDLIPRCRVTGELRLAGADLLDPTLDVVALRRRVGLIFQRPNPFPFSIRHNLDLPLREAGVRRKEPRAAAIERCLRAVGLWDEVHDRLDHAAGALSGGQQQRLCIARALLLDPEVLLMDEPCSALDPISGATVEALIGSLKERCTIVIVTHNLAQARRVADRCALFWLRDGIGTIVEQGTVGQIFHAPKSEITAAYVRGAVA
ncbi:phosphate ABC transporter ATP-binding protein (PhoT family) [Azospirillum brasilense]|uniref:Phosphate ABC transporter ATP-binding protein (PhoT family) n=1 Tax=Azospirillum brasilense TaxID=192 RepID=A0A560CSR0_AZOBR|nr:phosphate ABC transporter ATP-binding protein [Azospirillum brasilense]TWA87895.1 phosphate ABC transporter ATP-binding protein (PhoT family) [Azospirillum brasilense]